MIERTEIETSSFRIAKAEKRLTHQRDAIEKLGLGRDTGHAMLANDLLALMEEGIAALKQRHIHLVGKPHRAW